MIVLESYTGIFILLSVIIVAFIVIIITKYALRFRIPAVRSALVIAEDGQPLIGRRAGIIHTLTRVFMLMFVRTRSTNSAPACV